MFYPIGNTTIDSDKYREKFAKRYYLPFMKELIDLSGCSLKEAKELIDKVIHEEGIIINQTSKEIQDTCLAELQDN
ncbi:hypothetical protein AMS59_20910 [Lysinibacillus sp. FJAT-14745]|uniref:hypothetical protein n=1 Tax=Lysinibacillus sp. FJAT-14745 TaxID=1704289 RepID=UPI0006ABE41C|nr:hypothetical protein [Lysinibacillus sp. FJAT-14745]KOP70284.1 hypothetical protein AMS59_20910 [Lysinibacillus sp. FJAT-14745]